MRLSIAAAVFAGAGFFCLGAQRAQAAVEFCPATVTQTQAIGGAQSAATYSYRLGAESARVVKGEIAIETDAGWFAAPFADVALAAHVSRYDTDQGTYALAQAVSPLLYVRFPKPVTVKGLWVQRAAAPGESEFGWGSRGEVTCAPTPYRRVEDPSRKSLPADHLHDEDRLSYDVPPRAKDAVASAQRIEPLATSACANPFDEAWATDIAVPHYPQGVRNAGAVVIAKVAVSSEGHLIDAWVVGNSGLTTFAPYALAAAQQTTYHSAIAYCRPVPSIYLFRTTFSPVEW